MTDRTGAAVLSCASACAPGSWSYCPDDVTPSAAPTTPSAAPTISIAPTPEPSAAPVQLRLDMHDSYGDGWNGAVLTWALQDGSAVQTVSSFTSGHDATESLNVFDPDGCYNVTVSSGQ